MADVNEETVTREERLCRQLIGMFGVDELELLVEVFEDICEVRHGYGDLSIEMRNRHIYEVRDSRSRRPGVK